MNRPKSPPFVPPAAVLRRLRQEGGGGASCFRFAWEREDGCCQRFEFPVPAGRESSAEVLQLAERSVKFVLWAAGGWRLRLAGPEALCRAVEAAYGAGGARGFDREMMARVYGRALVIERCAPDAVPETRDALRSTGTSWKGCRLGFDLGASDFKIAAVQDGEVRFQSETPWDPRNATTVAYHYERLNGGLREAAGRLPRVDAIGGSTAGIVVDNRMCFASLFRGIPKERYEEARSLFQRLEKEWGVPVEVANDGDVTALAAYLADGQAAVLGVAMGSSEAAGYLDRQAHLTGRLNELAFAPVDFAPEAPADEWSGDQGVGAMYFSQQAVARLAPHFGLDFPADMPLPDRLVKVQERMAGDEPAVRALYETIGVHLGHSVAWYRAFYDFDRLLLLGRVTTGRGGDLLLESARRTLAESYSDLASVQLAMPDEKSKRLGQSVAAAALCRTR